MNQPMRRVLIVGGGFSGMTTAIECARRGFEVDLVEIDAGWRIRWPSSCRKIRRPR
jgi:glycine/D-amino acid oxidase-like deaminating enzyme